MEFLSKPENVGLARVTVAAFAAEIDFPLSVLEEVKVAVSEAVSNAVIHGYQGDPSRLVTMTATLESGVLEIKVRDEGIGIADLELALQPGSSSDPERMGLGFVFMKTFMDELEVLTEVGKGTTVRLLKKLPGVTAASGH